MATLKTNEASKQDAGLLSARVQGNIATGDIRYIEATYVATGSEAATGDVIDITDVPVGAVVLPEKCLVANEASLGGSAVALATIGDAVDADRYSATSISVHSSNAAVQAVTPAIGTSVIPRFVVTEATKRIQAAFSRTNAITAGKKIVFSIAYRLP